MTTEYQDSIRDGFEVYIAKQLKLEAISKEVLAVQVFAMNDNREYKDKKLQLKWGEWEAACSQQIEKDAGICVYLIEQIRAAQQLEHVSKKTGDDSVAAIEEIERAIRNQEKE